LDRIGNARDFTSRLFERLKKRRKPLKLLRQSPPDPQQLALQLDFFSSDFSAQPSVDQPAPTPSNLSTLLKKPAAPDMPPALANGMRRMQCGEHFLDYFLRRSKRKSIGFLIDEDGLRITAPRWVSVAEIEHAIREKQRWIFAKLNERRERSARRLQPQMRWCDGGMLPYLGREITLRLDAAQAAGIRYDESANELVVSLPADAAEQQLKDRVQGWLQLEARRVFAERLAIYTEKLGVAFSSFALSSATTQWGSCTADGKIRLNWRLVHFSLPLIDYVIAHELAHLREMNHGPEFWATVQSIFPDFQDAKKALRDRAAETLPVF
jgi:predicted metal-dependent hydrolase